MLSASEERLGALSILGHPSGEPLPRETLVSGRDDPDVTEAFSAGTAVPFLSRAPRTARARPAGRRCGRSLPSRSNMFAGLINKKINLTEAETYQSQY